MFLKTKYYFLLICSSLREEVNTKMLIVYILLLHFYSLTFVGILLSKYL